MNPRSLARWKMRFMVSVTVAAIMATSVAATSFINATVTGYISVSSAVYSSGTGCKEGPPTGWASLIPGSRVFPALAADTSGDSNNGLALMFGGETWKGGTALGDTWVYQSGCWALANATGGASQSTWSQCGYGQTYTMPLCASSSTVTKSYTGAQQSWTVPNGVSVISVDMYGAAGGAAYGAAGNGGRVQADVSVTGGSTVYIYVGGQGAINGGAGGWNGGGNACNGTCDTYGTAPGAGGGASDIRIGGTALNNRVVVAGGGGGGGGGTTVGTYGTGGAGGGTSSGGAAGNGVDGSSSVSCAAGSNTGKGGTGGSGSGGGGGAGCDGAADTGVSGSQGSGGAGGSDAANNGGGGGAGGGYYGGGGGGAGFLVGGGGGGGSSYCSSSCIGTTTFTKGYSSATGNGQVVITYPSSVPSIEPMKRFGASMVYDPTFKAFILYGGCNTISSAGANYPDVCDTSTGSTIMSDTWAFFPLSFGNGYWKNIPTATCDYGYPYANGGDESMYTSPGSGYVYDNTCQWIFSFGTTGSSGSNYCSSAANSYYCGSLGVYGASMVYDPYTTQCANGGNTCILLYGGATYWSTHSTTDIGPCTSIYSLHATYPDVGNYCSDTLWEMEGSSLSNIQWIDENSAVTYNTSYSASCTGTPPQDSWGYCAYSYFSPGNYPYDYPSGEGRVFAQLIAPNCSGSGCTLVLTGGEESSNAASGEAAQADTWYISGSINRTAWTHLTTNEVPASEAAWEIYDQIPTGSGSGQDTTLHNKVVYSGGVAPTGGTEAALTVTGVYYFDPTSPGSGWTLDTITSHPTDIDGGSGFYDSLSSLVLVFGGSDMTLSEPASEYFLV